MAIPLPSQCTCNVGAYSSELARGCSELSSAAEISTQNSVRWGVLTPHLSLATTPSITPKASEQQLLTRRWSTL